MNFYSFQRSEKEMEQLKEFCDCWDRWSFDQMLEMIISMRLQLFYERLDPTQSWRALAIYHTVMDDSDLLYIYVPLQHRRKGLAANLLDYSAAVLHSKQVNRIFLEVRTSNTSAKKLYESKHFIKYGLRRGYYSDNGEDAELYQRQLSSSPEDK